MRLMIEIPDDEYFDIVRSDRTTFADRASKECMLHAIRNGTLLPKGHGDLIDRNDYDKRLESIWKFYHGDETIHDTVDDFDLRFADGVSRAREALNDAPTIIGADGGGEDGVSD